MKLVGFEEADHRIPDHVLVRIDSLAILRDVLQTLKDLGYVYDPVFCTYVPPIHQDSEDYFYDE